MSAKIWAQTAAANQGPPTPEMLLATLSAPVASSATKALELLDSGAEISDKVVEHLLAFKYSTAPPSQLKLVAKGSKDQVRRLSGDSRVVA